MDNRTSITAITGGYNYSYVDKLITETYPRWASKYVQFVEEETDIRMYFDYPFNENDSCLIPAKCSIAVTEEPYFVVPEFNHFLYHHGNMFDAIFTSQSNLMALNRPNIWYYPMGACSIAPEKRRIYDKSKLVCAIFSFKNRSEGHRLRQEIRESAELRPYIDFVNSVPFVENKYEDKIDLINQYMYSVVVENEFDMFFSEKLVDCFVAGCIPIYKRTKWINREFDPNGIILFDTIEELKSILLHLSKTGAEQYYHKKDSIVTNYERACERFTTIGDTLWTYGLRDVLHTKGLIR